jgi:indole-3-glycerol phosphate synthase
MTILDGITHYKRKEIEEARGKTPMAALQTRARAQATTRGFFDCLKRVRGARQVGLIAEIKRASPSKGVIRADFDARAIAVAYEKAGATCLSVLTDAPSFQGALDFMLQARQGTALPVLRKDFMLDPYQVVEARAFGADAILVILACVSDIEARALIDEARRWSLDVLVEVHDEGELKRALALDAEMIGINNRDLHSFKTDLGVSEHLGPLVPRSKLVIAESGISVPADIARLQKVGVTTFLVGESLLREDDVAAATRRLLAG